MRGIGYEPEEARILADHVIDAALCGYEYSGLAKLLNVADHPRFKAPRTPESPAHIPPLLRAADGPERCCRRTEPELLSARRSSGQRHQAGVSLKRRRQYSALRMPWTVRI